MLIRNRIELADSRVFISGSVGMVYSTLEQLEAKGIQEANCHSDVFAYAPRPKKD